MDCGGSHSCLECCSFIKCCSHSASTTLYSSMVVLASSNVRFCQPVGDSDKGLAQPRALLRMKKPQQHSQLLALQLSCSCKRPSREETEVQGSD